MSLPLLHSPADVTRWVIITVLGLGSNPDANPPGAWPAYEGVEPSGPDDCITVTNTTPVTFGSTQVDGEELKHWGVMVRVRSADPAAGWLKAEAVRRGLAEDVYAATVVINGTSYRVHCYARFNGPIDLGKNVPGTKRSLFTVNATVALRALP